MTATHGALPLQPAQEEQLPLLPAQEGVLFTERLAGQIGTHNVALALRFRGPLVPDVVASALDAVVERHEALRMHFIDTEGGPRQSVGRAHLRMDNEDFHTVDDVAAQRVVAEYAQAAQKRPFDLASAPLARASLLRFGSEHHVLILVAHHTAVDGSSMEILADELATLCRAMSMGRPDPLSPLTTRYSDFVAASEPHRHTSRLENYWRTELSGAPATVDLPRARTGSDSQRVAATHQRVIPSRTVARLRNLSDPGSLFAALAAGAFALVAQYTGGDDIVLGAPMSGRIDPGSDSVVGLTVNVMPLRVRLPNVDIASFSEILRQVQVKTLNALRFQGVSFGRLVQVVNPQRVAGRQPVFQIALNHGVEPSITAADHDLIVGRIPVPNATAAFELMLTFVERGDSVVVYCEYDLDRFDVGTIESLADHLVRLLGEASARPHDPLATLDLVGPEERALVIEDWNRTEATIPDATIVELFDRQVHKSGGQVAVRWADTSITYGELNDRANTVATSLAARGVGSGEVVGIALPRSIEMIVAVMAVLKTGGAYLPLDPSYPSDRLAFMVADARPAIVITNSSTTMRHDARTLLIDAVEHAVTTFSPPPLRPSSPAYVIYASGSTGRPKGVVVTHRNVANLAVWAAANFGDGLSRVLASTSLNFDVSVFEIFGPLLAGGSIEIVRDLLEISERGGWSGTLICGVPSVLAHLIADGQARLRADYLVVAGEQLTEAVAAKLRTAVPGARLVNAYGPTEATVYACCSDTSDAIGVGAPSIGRPIRNTQLYVLNSRMRPVPVGVPGDLYIGGAGLTLGYLRRDELTAERFTDSKFGRIYRTGDITRWRPDGQMEYLGRSDGQIKLRGFRIETGEIETVLHEQPGVTQAVVVMRTDGGSDGMLVGYVTPATVDPTAVRRGAAQILPSYMVPTFIVAIESFPLSPTGKLDRDALPAPPASSTGGRSPSTPTEQTVAAVFASALELSAIAAADSFFDLGGHSLMAITVIEQIRKLLDTPVTVRDLLEAATVESLAQRIDSGVIDRSKDFAVLLPLRPSGHAPPLFCVHPGFGLSWAYAAILGHLSPEQPLYGLQARGIGNESSLPQTFSELVDDYLEQILAIHPHGPYRLLGWSFGGLVAYEIAIRLQNAGEQVDLLALLDTVLLDDSVEVDSNQERREIAAVAQIVPDQDRLISVVRNLMRLRHQFTPRRFVGDVLVFTAELEPESNADLAETWRPHIEGNIIKHPIVCEHLEMMTAAPAAQIGTILRKYTT